MTLLQNSQLEELSKKSWQYHAYNHFKNKIIDKEKLFPCIPATQAFSLNHLRYGFVGSPIRPETSKELAELLKDYSINYKDFGKYTSLIVFFNTPQELKLKSSVEDFEVFFWQHLINLNNLDEVQWPVKIPKNPDNPFWEFCFHGEQYFMYCATPAHKNRKSRYSPYMLLAITPRSALMEFNTNEQYALKVKNQIRSRLKDYDTLPIHSSLNSYGKKDNFEWKQYYLHDDHTELIQCPFIKRNNN
ncbi:YqcI/YcgG family protein [Cytobacillus dafuensis]|uniref:YqcI/YcgG family protein n=1 Tax=Cytobacillus dafuensis TaxID=1742359 RepID=A0A5B8Z956_CYTDA|nr:YqcI/YcgG family protein [Cytobacillus dafuensis]QED48229.1 YqcI/YcgG family protein [Cytobacillus dafuensis]